MTYFGKSTNFTIFLFRSRSNRFHLQERRRQLELPGLLHRLAHLGQKNQSNENQYGHVGGQGGQGGQPGQGGAGHSGTLNRYHHDDSLYYGPIKSIQESDRDLSTSSPVLLQLYDAVKVS